MIPKVIHYCWFGGNPLPADAIKCIDSWRRFLPDYKLKEWNESNFDINSNQYVREAYQNRKFAFVTDYVRLFALATEGGIYMDTDVEVLKSYDPFLHHTAFSGFENNNFVPTGMMASEKGGQWVKELLEYYNNRPFIKEDGSMDTTTNTRTITDYMLSHGLIMNNTYQDFPDLVTMYPSDYFCPKDHRTGNILITPNSVCVHHFACSWLSSAEKRRHKLKLLMTKIFGAKISGAISKIIN